MIRRYEPTDLPRLREITAICFEHVSIDRNIEARFGGIAGHDWRWRKLRHIDADVAGPNAEGVFVFETEAGVIAGFVTGRVDRESGIGWIPNLAVHPDFQGHGIGRRLMNRILDFFRAEGMEVAKIETLDQNEIGSGFYPSLGFEEVARQIHFAMRL